jgi:hypothetical protein
MPVGADDVASGPSRYPCDADASWWHAERACADAAVEQWRLPCGDADESSADDSPAPSGAASDASWWWHAERACADDAVEQWRLPCGDADDERDSCCALGASDAWP